MNIHLAQWEWENTLFFCRKFRVVVSSLSVCLCVCISCICSFSFFIFPNVDFPRKHPRRAWPARDRISRFISLPFSLLHFGLTLFDRSHFRKKETSLLELIARVGHLECPASFVPRTQFLLSIFWFLFFFSFLSMCGECVVKSVGLLRERSNFSSRATARTVSPL